MPIAIPPPQPHRRLGPIALTVLAHAALLLAWHAARPPLPVQDGPRRAIQWIRLPALQTARPAARPAAIPAPAHPLSDPVPPIIVPHVRPAVLPALPRVPAAGAPSAAVGTVAADAPSADAPSATAPTLSAAPAAVPGQSLLERARKQAGAVDRALRKENHAYIAAPLDSPQIRMRKGMEEAAAMAPNAWYQAPKVEELVNNTGDGARRTRVVTGNGTYCLTERAPTTSIDMIEKHGKRWPPTNCPAHETPANPQAWRTARD
jgi:hypothetical protein